MAAKKTRKIDPKAKGLSLLDEFKAFAFKGNVIDLAVGVIIGAAFGRIVSSMVDQVIMPLITAILPVDQRYEEWSVTVGSQVIEYGRFLAEVVNFLIVALALFLFIVKFLGWLMRSKQQEVEQAPAMTKDQELLTEIRDLLRERKAAS